MLENAMTFFFQACILHSGISEDHQKNFVNIFCASLASAWRAYSQTIVLFKCEIVCGQDFQAPVVWLHTIAVYFAYRNSEVSTCFSIYIYGRQACHSDHKRGGTACYPHTPVRPWAETVCPNQVLFMLQVLLVHYNPELVRALVTLSQTVEWRISHSHRHIYSRKWALHRTPHQMRCLHFVAFNLKSSLPSQPVCLPISQHSTNFNVKIV